MGHFKSYYAVFLILATALTLTDAVIHVYSDAEFQGFVRTLPRFKACLDLTHAWNDQISSINTHDNCVILCEHRGCKGQCERFEPGTWRHNHFGALNFNDKASSYKSC